MYGFSNLKGNQAPKHSEKIWFGNAISQKNGDIDHIPRINNPSNIIKKEMKDNTQFRNLKDSMMVSLRAFLKYSHNVRTQIISSNKILPYYPVILEHIVPDILELKTGVTEHVVPKYLELQ